VKEGARPLNSNWMHEWAGFWLMSSGTVSRSGPSGTVPHADGRGSGQTPGGGGWAPLWSESSGLHPVGQ